MGRYIALLRGVNVGGKNKISMPRLKRALEERGFERVITYINSGNVIFDSGFSEDAAKIACETVIFESFGLEIAVCIISACELREALANAPDWWNNGGESKHNAIFVIPPAGLRMSASVSARSNRSMKGWHSTAGLSFGRRRLRPFPIRAGQR